MAGSGENLLFGAPLDRLGESAQVIITLSESPRF